MKQSQSQTLMDEYPQIERFSASNDQTNIRSIYSMRPFHGFTPVSYRHPHDMGLTIGNGKTPISYRSFLGDYSAFTGSNQGQN